MAPGMPDLTRWGNVTGSVLPFTARVLAAPRYAEPYARITSRALAPPPPLGIKRGFGRLAVPAAQLHPVMSAYLTDDVNVDDCASKVISDSTPRPDLPGARHQPNSARG